MGRTIRNLASAGVIATLAASSLTVAAAAQDPVGTAPPFIETWRQITTNEDCHASDPAVEVCLAGSVEDVLALLPPEVLELFDLSAIALLADDSAPRQVPDGPLDLALEGSPADVLGVVYFRGIASTDVADELGALANASAVDRLSGGEVEGWYYLLPHMAGDGSDVWTYLSGDAGGVGATTFDGLFDVAAGAEKTVFGAPDPDGGVQYGSGSRGGDGVDGGYFVFDDAALILADAADGPTFVSFVPETLGGARGEPPIVDYIGSFLGGGRTQTPSDLTESLLFQQMLATVTKGKKRHTFQIGFITLIPVGEGTEATVEVQVWGHIGKGPQWLEVFVTCGADGACSGKEKFTSQGRSEAIMGRGRITASGPWLTALTATGWTSPASADPAALISRSFGESFRASTYSLVLDRKKARTGAEPWSEQILDPFAADLNGDDVVDRDDEAEWLRSSFLGLPEADVDGDGRVTSADLSSIRGVARALAVGSVRQGFDEGTGAGA